MKTELERAQRRLEKQQRQLEKQKIERHTRTIAVIGLVVGLVSLLASVAVGAASVQASASQNFDQARNACLEQIADAQTSAVALAVAVDAAGPKGDVSAQSGDLYLAVGHIEDFCDVRTLFPKTAMSDLFDNHMRVMAGWLEKHDSTFTANDSAMLLSLGKTVGMLSVKVRQMDPPSFLLLWYHSDDKGDLKPEGPSFDTPPTSTP
jgi:hypothetical protein